ncbi:hypothetical protein [Nocardioides ferulae]|uniref:hypothetical protein n=1 Tax=Nocardioides ferulae TaxID=2340821 RepID=UPI000F879BF8|nr:hypothetical protein [Nocardioides ferulae]
MSGSTTRRRHRGLLGLVLSLVVALAASLAWTVPTAASPGAPAADAGADRAVKKLKITDVDLSCECGGAGYLWGWRVVSVSFDGGREGFTYKLQVKGGPTVPAGWSGYASVSQDQAGFEHGKTYRFRIQELKRGKITRATDWRRFRIPKPVSHPTFGGLETVTLGDQEVLVAGRTHRITFEGEWAEGTRFASGVDWFRGTEDGDDRFGYYEQDDYPLPFRIGTDAPILEFTPGEEYVGTTWSIEVVGYRPAPKADRAEGIKKGDPVPGSEWGWSFSVPVVSADEVPAD